MKLGGSMNKKPNIYNLIGQNIKKYRKQKGMTQRELAEANYLSDSFIAKLESVTYQTISIDTLEKIAISLDVEITKLFEKNDE
jgi:transcriptional regulator with XRE-family HTH domain